MMRHHFYTILAALSKIFGPWLFAIVSRGIAVGYFLFFPKRSAASARFYRVLFPQRTRAYAWWCAFRQFQNFTTVFFDRYLLRDPGAIDFTFEGREHLLAAVAQGRGGVLLMSHMGNWEAGARLLRRNIPDLRLMLYMGRRAQEQIERLQKEDLAASGIRILAADEAGGSAFDLVEGAAFLKSGGFVSMAGDVVWRPDQQTVAVRFLDHRVRLPEAPFMLALVSRVPLYIFFATRRGPQKYHFSVTGPVAVTADRRDQRREAIRKAAQSYAAQLETQVQRYPQEWYHFQPFLGPPAAPDPAADP
jgi:predicted LPLAT superfamily acyltransferase